jgi:DNA-binding transcriptional LysR family regulator
LDFRIRQLQCFIVLSDLLHYGKSARALYISQPTLTFQIKSLEEVFGAKLFERTRQHVRLTDAGYAFREYAQSILDTVDAARECIGGLDARLRLRIACGPVGQYILLPAVIRTLAAEHPDFELEVLELTTEQQLMRLPEGKVDALLMMSALPIPAMRFDPISRETLVAMVSQQSTLASHSAISVHDFREHSIIASRAKDCPFHQPFLHSLLAPYGITPRIVEAPQSCSVQFAYAAAGEGIALTTASMSACKFPNLVALPFVEPLPELQLGLSCMQSNNSAAMNIFREVVLKSATPQTSVACEGSHESTSTHGSLHRPITTLIPQRAVTAPRLVQRGASL